MSANMNTTATVGMGRDEENEDEEAEEIDNSCPLGVCDGSGEIGDLEWDDDAKCYRSSGVRPCLCQKKDDDDVEKD